MKLTKQEMETAQFLVSQISELPELEVIGAPCMTIISFKPRSEVTLNIFAVADVMESKGWKIERNAVPQSIHCTLMPQHTPVRVVFVFVLFSFYYYLIFSSIAFFFFYRFEKSLSPTCVIALQSCKQIPRNTSRKARQQCMECSLKSLTPL